ncbi:uncharacterized protein LOC143018058 isoform X1 [Oratosquilla oratoria]|uniref:uncharacterized protein LOC143018058 isoform X1 n=1 Tax=Oratosquilla oratoria TaxID=337810 RepID=UPI003F773D77
MQDCRMMLACWAGFLLLVSFASSASSARLTPIGESDMVGLPERLRDLVLLRRLVYGPEVAAGPEPAESSVPIVRKRTCYINGGLSHGCDYMDLVGAMAEKSYWDSLRSPGRRKRQVALQKLFPNSISAFPLPRPSSSSTVSSFPSSNFPSTSSSLPSTHSLAPFKHMSLSSMPSSSSSSSFQNPSSPPSPDLSSSDLQ